MARWATTTCATALERTSDVQAPERMTRGLRLPSFSQRSHRVDSVALPWRTQL